MIHHTNPHPPLGHINPFAAEKLIPESAANCQLQDSRAAHSPLERDHCGRTHLIGLPLVWEHSDVSLDLWRSSFPFFFCKNPKASEHNGGFVEAVIVNFSFSSVPCHWRWIVLDVIAVNEVYVCVSVCVSVCVCIHVGLCSFRCMNETCSSSNWLLANTKGNLLCFSSFAVIHNVTVSDVHIKRGQSFK